MFTGIIKETGKISNIIPSGDGRVLKISCKKILTGMQVGDSVSVDGICLTVTDRLTDGFKCDVSSNTLRTTTLSYLKVSSIVNLEDALRVKDKLGGHIVTGHIDSTVKLLGVFKQSNAFRLEIEMPQELRAFIAPRGSVALNGISLTVTDVKKHSFSVYIIPHTYKNTNIFSLRPGSSLNLECDILSRYVANSLAVREQGDKSIDDDRLKEKLIEYGFYE